MFQTSASLNIMYLLNLVRSGLVSKYIGFGGSCYDFLVICLQSVPKQNSSETA